MNLFAFLASSLAKWFVLRFSPLKFFLKKVFTNIASLPTLSCPARALQCRRCQLLQAINDPNKQACAGHGCVRIHWLHGVNSCSPSHVVCKLATSTLLILISLAVTRLVIILYSYLERLYSFPSPFSLSYLCRRSRQLLL